MSPLVCVAMAAALLCAPGPVARGRLSGLWPAASARRAWQPWSAGPVLLGGAVGLLVGGPGGAVAGALVAFTVRSRRRRSRAAATAAATAEQLADAVLRMTDELRAGSHPTAALAGVGADGPHAQAVLAPAVSAADLGDDIPGALRRAAAERPEVAQDVERVAAAWALAERHGIPLAELLAGAQADVRWRMRFGNTVRAQLAGPRATASVLTVLPLLGLGLGQLIGADPVGVLRSGVLGQIVLVVGVGLVAAGSAWTERILRSAVPR